MNPVLIFQHIACEGPGYLGSFLDSHHISYKVIRIDQGQQVPDSLNVAGLVFMGGPMSANDDLAWIAEELLLIQRAQEADIPLLGHCLGAQLISKALGGEVNRNDVTEIGWFPVKQAVNPVAEIWLKGLSDEFDVFHLHGETFSLPAGADLLLHNSHCARQGFVIGKTLAMQCHIEVTAELLREWVSVYAADLKHTSDSVQSAAAILAECEQRIHNLQCVADHLYTRWISNIRA